MTFTFESSFTSQISQFIEQKRALGFLYNDKEGYLFFFDKHCTEHFPNEDKLTKEIGLSWAVKHDTEVSSFRNRLGQVREFAKYLNGRGEPAYIITNKYGKDRVRNVPYIYSEDEISLIWDELDHIATDGIYPMQHLVISVLVRLLYCCGLRPCEAFRLLVDDMDLNAGKIYIRESNALLWRRLTQSEI